MVSAVGEHYIDSSESRARGSCVGPVAYVNLRNNGSLMPRLARMLGVRRTDLLYIRSHELLFLELEYVQCAKEQLCNRNSLLKVSIHV